MRSGLLYTIALTFGGISLLAIGGVTAVIPEMHRVLVDQAGLVNGPDFTALVALAQAAPGPNVMIVGLLGWQIAGVAGAAVAIAAMCGPCALLAIAVRRSSRRFPPQARRLVSEALAPITAGLLLASGYTLTSAAGFAAAWVIAAASAAILTLRPRVDPLWLLAGAAAVGAVARNAVTP